MLSFRCEKIKKLSRNPLILICFLFISFAFVKEGSGEEPKTVTSVSEAVADISPWGIDLGSVQQNIAPGDNFYQFANGNWEKSAEIPDGKWFIGSQTLARERTELLTDSLVKDLLEQEWPENSDEAKFVAVYRSYMNTSRKALRGRGPLELSLRRIARARSHGDIAALLGNYQLGAGGLFDIVVRIDPEGKQVYLPSLEPAELLLGRPLVYLRSEAHLQAKREEGADLLRALLRQSGPIWRPQARVGEVLALEAKIAALYPDRGTLRNVSQDRVFMSLEDLEAAAPSFPWRAYFRQSGVTQTDRIHVRIAQNIEPLAALFAGTKVSVWRDYLRLRLMSEYGAFLSDRIARNAEALDALRRGVVYVRPGIDERAKAVAMQLVPDAIGRSYLKRPGLQERIAAAETIAEAIRDTFRERIQNADWPTDATKARALEKLESVAFMIGAPPSWNDYSGFRPDEAALFENVYWQRQIRKASALSRLKQPKEDVRESIETLRSRVFFSPLQLGAYYLPRLNTVIIPANYLQAPYYDPNADMAVNFGALGTTIGHELGHAFDDQGSKHGRHGQLENWWTAKDRERFDGLAHKLSSQFSTYEAVPGIPVNAELTLGENLSDLVGLGVVYEAYELMRQKQSETGQVPDRREGARRFLLGYTQKRKFLRRPNIAFELALTGVHSPPEHRVNGIVRNLDYWYEAFDVGPEHALWLPPEERIKVW